jgi:hypothetical protein
MVVAEAMVNSRKRRRKAGNKKQTHRQEKARARCDCDSVIFNKERCRKLTGRGETTAFTSTSNDISPCHQFST